MTTTFLPFSRPDIGKEEISAVAATLSSGWITSGPSAAQLESDFKAFVGAQHALAVNSCTAGLHLALASLGVGHGDEVITTPLTFCSTVNVILQVGATPILADIGPDLNLDPASTEAACTSRTRAILPVHMAGLPCEMDAFWELAKRRGVHVIEDAAHASGAAYKGVPVGRGRSDAVVFSFYATKNLTTGEGGMITAHDAKLYNRMKLLCLHGISHDAWNRYSENGTWYYEVTDCGFKYNMSDILAAIGIQQLRKLAQMNSRRKEIVAAYNEAFAGFRELELPPDCAERQHAWHLYILRLNLDRLTIDRAEFFHQMHNRGIGCSVHFIPIPLHPYYRRTLEFRDPCSRALAEYPRLISLPLYSKMTDEDIERVVKAVRDIVARNSVRQTVGFPRQEIVSAHEAGD